MGKSAAQELLLEGARAQACLQEGRDGQAQALMWTVYEMATACPGR